MTDGNEPRLTGLLVRGKGPRWLVPLKVEGRIKRLPKRRNEELVGRADRVLAVVAMVRREARRGN